MPKDKISQYAFTPAANTDIGGINIDEGCAPSGINNAIRTLMTQIRDLQAGVSGDTIPLTAGGTGSGTAASARAALGLAIGTNVLGYVTPGASGNVLQSDGTNWTSKAATAVTLDTITGGPLTVAKGGTGATALASGTVLLGNGTSRVQFATAGATGQVLTSTGTGWSSQAVSGGQFQTEFFTAPGTWTKPASCTQVRVMVVGGGGGGSGRTPLNVTGAAGSGGSAYAMVPVSAPVTITIGAGGAPSSPGGTSSFGPAVSCTGGGGGSTSGQSTPLPGTPGTGTVAVGTALRTTTAPQSFSFITFGGDGKPYPTTTPGVYTASGSISAGNAGTAAPVPGQTTGNAGNNGAIVVEFVG